MRFLLPLMIVGILLVGGSGLFVLQKKVAAGDISMPSAGDTALGDALSIVVENATGQTTIKTEGDITGFAPAAPDGWTVRPYDLADGTALTGKEIIRSTVSKSTTNSILLAYARDARAGEEAIAVTYENGDRKIALRMRLMETFNERTLHGGIMSSISGTLSAQAFSGDGGTTGLFAKHDGIEVILKPQYSTATSSGGRVPVPYRTFESKIGPYVEIQAITNAADADIAAIFSRIDIKTLNEMLPAPAPEYREGVGWLVASTEPLSTEPPGPTLAEKAYDILNDGRIHSKEDSDLMSLMVNGRVKEWSDVRTYSEPSSIALDLLGPEPDDRKVKRMATVLREREEQSHQMRSVLGDIASGRINSQAELFANRNFGDLTITPEFRAIMGLLPVGEVTQTMLQENQATQEEAPQPMTNTAPVIRRGVSVDSGMTATTCTIELGVRRCVVGQANTD